MPSVQIAVLLQRYMILKPRHRSTAVAYKAVMALTMRPTGLGSGAYQENIDYNIFSGEWLIGRIYERNGFPDAVRFFWALC
jgi:hypothetical protein